MLKFLLPRKNSAPEPEAKKDDAPMAAPAYYEVWGGLESANRALWVGLWISCTFSLLSLLLLRAVLRRPPVVLSIGADGQVRIVSGAAQASSAEPQPSRAEIENFVSLFERFFTELNCYTVNADLKQAFSMMTPEFRQQARDGLNKSGKVERLKTQKLHANLVITEITIKDDTAQAIDCEVQGYRDIASYLPGVAAREEIFQDDIVLEKVPRSDKAPYGLLVEDYAATFFKK